MKFALSAIAAAALVAAAGAADAASYRIAQQAGSIFGTPDYSRTANTNIGNFGAGPFRLTADDLADGLGGDVVDIIAFCVDIADSIVLPRDFDTAPNLFTGVTLARIDALFSNAPVSGIDSRDKGAATQAALWEIITDSDLDLTTGGFQVTSLGTAGALALANDYLSNIDDGTWTGTGAEFTFLRAGTQPNQELIAFGLPAPNPIPLPASAWLLVASLAGLGALRRKHATA